MFIGSYNYRFVLILITIVCTNYLIAKYMCYMKNMRFRKVVIVLAVAINVGMLVFFKYCNWLRVLINPNAILWKVLIPIGISFYTLEQVCYLIDTYKSGEMKYTILEYLIFSTYFPVIFRVQFCDMMILLHNLDQKHVAEFRRRRYVKD